MKVGQSSLYPWLQGAALGLAAMVATVTLSQATIKTETAPTQPSCTPGSYDKDGKYVEDEACSKEYTAYQDAQTKFQATQQKTNQKQVGVAAIIAAVLLVAGSMFSRKAAAIKGLAAGGAAGLVGLALVQMSTYTSTLRATILGLFLLAILVIGWTWLDPESAKE